MAAQAMDRFRELVPENVRDMLAIAVVTAGGCWVAIKLTGCVAKWISEKRVKRRWKNTPKDVVILHKIVSAYNAPNPSPFVLKLETYLRMADIPYEVDLGDVMGPKGKTPWITLNGEHISDSQICIERLAKKFDKRIGKYGDNERAISTLVRVALDEHFYWGLLMWRYVQSWDKGLGPDKVFPLPIPFFMMPFVQRLARSLIMPSCHAQGIGRHSDKEIIQIMTDDLRAVSRVLGNKKFILGDEPCEDDCAIFGELAQAVWCLPGSPYENLLNTEFQNLKQYCYRMKELYWPDWDEQCYKK